MEPRSQTPARRGLEIALVLAFAAAVGGVALATFESPARPDELEREFRRAAARPERPSSLEQWLAWPEAFEAWYGDHFALRSKLVRWHNLVKLEAFGTSPTSEIVLGPDDWMFTTRDRAVDVFRGVDPLSEIELELWREVLDDRRAWLAERGIAYVFAIAPNKETIYPERFPARFDKVGDTRREQMIARAGTGFPVLDLAPALLEAKRAFAADGPVYFPLGTHWNDRGALYAYRALMQRVAELAPAVAPRPLEDFRLVPTDFQDDSWAGRLYVEDLLRQENVELEFERHFPREYWEDVRLRRVVDVTTEIPGSSLPRAVVFHDSMGEKLRPLIAEHFSRCAFRWVSNFDTDLIEREEPDVVIQVFVERALAAFSLSTSPMDTPERLEREFAASTRVLLESAAALRPGTLAPSTTAQATIEVVPEGDVLRLRYGGGSVLLPELDVPSGTWPVLRLEIDAPQPTQALIEFLTRRFPSYSRIARGVRSALAAGPNVVYVKLRVPDLTGRLRLHPGLVPGEYVLRGLEVRAVPASRE